MYLVVEFIIDISRDLYLVRHEQFKIATVKMLPRAYYVKTFGWPTLPSQSVNRGQTSCITQ
jgi:hypothetical protein